MEFKAIAVASCWISIAIIASVYMIVFASAIGDILFGVFLPVGLLVLTASLLTIYVSSIDKREKSS